MGERGVVLWHDNEFGTLYDDCGLELWLDDGSDYIVLNPDDNEADMLQEIEFNLADRGVKASDLEIIWAGR